MKGVPIKEMEAQYRSGIQCEENHHSKNKVMSAPLSHSMCFGINNLFVHQRKKISVLDYLK